MTRFGLSAFADPLLLARRQDHRAILASSYDRRGGNHDWSNYVRREGKQAVMMEADGPGVVTRFWTADPQKGTLRIFIDHNPKPVFEAPFAQFFEVMPLSFGIGGESPENYARAKADHLAMGLTNYCPIPFQSHCKITIDPEDDYLYYQINVHLLPPETKLESFHSPVSASSDVVKAAKLAVQGWSTNSPFLDMSKSERFDIELRPGETKQFAQWTGPGYVRGLRIALPKGATQAETTHLKENVWLVSHFDDDEPRDPSIRAPLGPFFFNFGQSLTPYSIFCGSDLAGGYCFFPMPHREKAAMAITNKSIQTVRISGWTLHEKLDPYPDDLFRFRATWRSSMPSGPDHRDYDGVACRLLNLDGANNYEMLRTFGGGHFVACAFEADFRESPTDRAGGEADEMFFIDDDARLTMNGTGTEDYFNDAWGMHGYIGPLSGDCIAEFPDAGPRLFGYRLHVPDPVPFTRTGRFTFEHGTGNNCSGLYRSVAFWYMDPALARTRAEERRWQELMSGTRKQNTD